MGRFLGEMYRFVGLSKLNIVKLTVHKYLQVQSVLVHRQIYTVPTAYLARVYLLTENHKLHIRTKTQLNLLHIYVLH